MILLQEILLNDTSINKDSFHFATPEIPWVFPTSSNHSHFCLKQWHPE